jgi:ferrochelatase
LAEALEAAADAGAQRVLVAPIGFVCDHTEILFDVDVEAAEAARRLGLVLGRTESLNTSPTFIRALADLVRAAS